MTRLGGVIVVLFAFLSVAAWQPAVAEAQYFWAAYSPDGESVLALRRKGFDVFEAESGMLRYRRPLLGDRAVSFSADGKSVIVAESDESAIFIREFDSRTGRETFSYNGAPVTDRDFWSLTPVPGKGFVTASRDGESLVWKRGRRDAELAFEVGRYPVSVLAGPDPDELTILREAGEIAIYSLATGKKIKSEFVLDAFRQGVHTKNNRSIIAIGSFDWNLRIYSFDAKNFKQRAQLREWSDEISVGYNTFAECEWHEKIVNIRRFSLKLKQKIRLPYGCWGVAMSPDSSRVLTFGQTQPRIDVWDVQSGKIVWTHGK